MKQLQTLKIMLLIVVSLVSFSGYSVAADDKDEYQGELLSGYTEKGKLSSDELWLFHGKKDDRIVITTAAENGRVPPEIYLYPPDESRYEVRSDISGNTQVLDYQLERSGRYAVMVHPYSAGDNSSYRIAYSILDQGDQYTINPDDPENLLTVTTPDDRSGKMFVDRSHGFLPATIVFDLATFGVGPIIYTGLSAVNQAVVGGIRLNDRIHMESLDLEAPPARG
jgi:hypothetical protein